MNEDCIGATRTAAWVIDGATGISNNPPLVTGLTDAAWLARKLSDELCGAFKDVSINPILALAEVENAITGAFAKHNSVMERTPGEEPSAAFALTVLSNNVLHLIGIGDCRIIFESQSGNVEDFNPSDAGEAESLIIDERRRLIAAYPNDDVWPRLKPFIRSLRESANLESGYSVVHPTRSWSNRVKCQTRDAAAFRHVLIVSDGLYRLVDVFRATDNCGLLKWALEDGLRRLCFELRRLEREDIHCRNYPRVKSYDDASAILLRII
jgi:hypothetical protein